MLNSILTSPITLPGLLICLGCALILGVLTALVFSFKTRISTSLALTLAVLPVAMCMVVVMINGNLGIAVAVAGGFTLVRFRSIAGTGREISAVFIVMTLGVITGMGYALLFVSLLSQLAFLDSIPETVGIITGALVVKIIIAAAIQVYCFRRTGRKNRAAAIPAPAQTTPLLM